VLSEVSYGGAMAETGGGFSACHHNMVVAMRISHGGP